MIIIIFYDFEVFEYDWLAVFIDVTAKKEYVIINNRDELKSLYEANRKDIWVGFYNRHYDQYIFKGILLGMNPKKINDWIIVDKKEGWQYSRAFNKIPMINYDVMPNPPVGLKTLEGFMGANIKETDVDFQIDRKLTPEEIQQTVGMTWNRRLKYSLKRSVNLMQCMGLSRHFRILSDCLISETVRQESRQKSLDVPEDTLKMNLIFSSYRA